MAAHARGAAAYATKAVGLARPGEPSAIDAEVRWQLRHSSPSVRTVLRRLPAPPPAAGTLGTLIRDLHLQLSGGG
jgi:hypothetical protein